MGRSIAAKTECGSPTENKHGDEGEGEGEGWETGTGVHTLPTRRVTPVSDGNLLGSAGNATEGSAAP